MRKVSINKIGFEIEGEFSGDVLDAIRATGLATTTDDGSIRDCDDEDIDHDELYKKEVVSIAFKRTDLKEQSKPLFKILSAAWRDNEFHANHSCGFHIHFSFRPSFVPQLFSRTFIEFFGNKAKEKYPDIYEERATDHNYRGESWCSERYDTKDFLRHEAYDEHQKVREAARHHDHHYSHLRYRMINLWMAYFKQKTIEVRLWPSASPKELQEYLWFTVDTIEAFLKIPYVQHAVEEFALPIDLETATLQVAHEETTSQTRDRLVAAESVAMTSSMNREVASRILTRPHETIETSLTTTGNDRQIRIGNHFSDDMRVPPPFIIAFTNYLIYVQTSRRPNQ